MVESREYDLSVIIPSVNGWQDLEGAIAALRAQEGGFKVQPVVVDRLGEELQARVRSEFPDVTLVPVPRTMTIPEMRIVGFAAAEAPVVGVIEDHVLVPPDWTKRMLAAHAQGAQVVGGSVMNAASDRLVDRAAFLCEYSHCLKPPAGDAEWLTGNNVTYRREILNQFRETIAEGRWEDHLHAAIRNAGIPLLSEPGISVGHKKHYTVREYLYQRYVYARAYAGIRLQGQPAGRRMVYGLAAFALPAVISYRILKRARAANVQMSALLEATPLLVLFVSAWGMGEVVGYLRGPGNALREVC